MRTFRHAVSLDERRAKFKPNLWNLPNAEEAKLGSKPKSTSTATASRALSSASPAAATGGPAPGPAVHQNTASFDDDPDKLFDPQDLLRKGFAPTNILPIDILPPSLHYSAKKDHGADVKGGDTSNGKSDKDHTKSQKGRKKEDSGDRALNTLERLYSEKDERMTDVEEVWFAVRSYFLLEAQR